MIRALIPIVCFLFAAVPSRGALQQSAALAEQAELIIARVQDEPITEQQVLAMIKQIAATQQLSPEQQLNQMVGLFTPALERLISLALLKREANEKEIKADKEKVEQEFQGIVGRFPSREAFEKALAQQGMKEEQLKQEVEQNLVFQSTLELRLAGIPDPTEEQIQKFYDEQGQIFTEPTTVHAAHILLRVDEDSTPEKKEEVRAKLHGVRAKIESGELQFADAAAEYSEDPSNAKNGGDLGFFPRGRMVQPFEDTAFATEAGQLSPVVETRFGFHLIRVLEHKPGGKLELARVRETIHAILRNQTQQGEIQQYLAELREKARVEILVSEEEWAKRHHP